MHGDVIARGLEFPEGPVWLDGDLICTEITAGAGVSAGRPGARPSSGSPRPVADPTAPLGPDGRLYVTQNGGMTAEGRVAGGILRVDLTDGSWEYAATEIAGLRLDGPNDLAVGPDGRLWFTDPRGAADPELNDRPGRIFALDPATGDGELIASSARCSRTASASCPTATWSGRSRSPVASFGGAMAAPMS